MTYFVIGLLLMALPIVEVVRRFGDGEDAAWRWATGTDLRRVLQVELLLWLGGAFVIYGCLRL